MSVQGRFRVVSFSHPVFRLFCLTLLPLIALWTYDTFGNVKDVHLHFFWHQTYLVTSNGELLTRENCSQVKSVFENEIQLFSIK